MQVQITQINRSNKTSKTGRPFESLGIKTKEHGDRWLSGFGRADNKSWKVGDTIEVNVVEKGDYLNFEQNRPSVQGFDIESRDRLLRVEIAVQQILNIVKSLAVDPKNVLDEPPF